MAEATASLRGLQSSARKARLVVDMIRGKKVSEARAILAYSLKGTAPALKKLLESAIANAENNLEMDRKELYVAEVFANQGPTLKRVRPRSRGMANPILKRTSHITVVLDRIAKEESK